MTGSREFESEDAAADVAARFYSPGAGLADYIIDYSIYESGAAWSCTLHNRYPPGPANVCLTFDDGPLRATIRGNAHEWRSDAVVFGPTSHAIDVVSRGGRLIGFGLTALGWSRLFGAAASRYANRVTPLSVLLPPAAVARLRDDVAVATDDAAIVASLDTFIAANLAPAGEEDGAIRALAGAILDPGVRSVGMLAEALDLSEEQTRRIATRHFGFPPKLLLRRVRFMRALMAMAERGRDTIDFTIDAPGYHDQSHFIRDARLFLGMTGRQFLHDVTPIMEAMRRGRAARFGQPLQGLIAPGHDNVQAAAAAAA